MIPLVLAAVALAHPFQPGLLVLTELDTDPAGGVDPSGGVAVQVRWEPPQLPVRRLAELQPSLPCTGSPAEGAWIVQCPAGLHGEITVPGLVEAEADVVVRVERADGGVQTGILRPSSPVFFPEQRAAPPTRAYLRLGVEHVLKGVDHLLFVLGLLLLVPRLRPLLLTITAFTAAHSLTLAASALDLVRVAQAPVEAVIALSVLLLAVELGNDPSELAKPTLTRRKPWLVAALFGLLHGFGFAGALREVGLPEGQVPLALLGFNMGVEIGQIAFVLVAMVPVMWLRQGPGWLRGLPAYCIGVPAAYWTFQRIWSFWG